MAFCIISVPPAFWPPIRFIPFVCRAVVFPSPSQDSPLWNNGGTALQACGGWALEGFVDNVSFLGLVRTHHSAIMGVRQCRWCGDVVGGHLKDLLTMSVLRRVRTHSEIMGVRHCRWCGDVVGGHFKDLLTMRCTFNGYCLFPMMNVKKERARGNSPSHWDRRKNQCWQVTDFLSTWLGR
jgi:hypothetical protein